MKLSGEGKIVRVFPRRTSQTPDDGLAFVGLPPKDLPKNIKEIHISITFSWDIKKGRKLMGKWGRIANVKIGGPAMGDKGGEFTPGMYVKDGHIITSRGCNNKCWYCDVWKREGKLREIKIRDGYNVTDNNLLQCSRDHILRLFEMLNRQNERSELNGGLEARLLKWWHVELFKNSQIRSMYFACDKKIDEKPLVEVGKMLRFANFTRSHMRCYTLAGYPRDTISEATDRLLWVWEQGFQPCVMIYRNKSGVTEKRWIMFRKVWTHPRVIISEIKKNIRQKVKMEERSNKEGR